MQVSTLRKKRLKSKSHSQEGWHPRSTSTSGAGSGASHVWIEKSGLWFLEAVWIDFLGNCWLDCGLVWLWSFKDVKNDM